MANENFTPLGENELNGFERHQKAREAQVASAASLWADLLGGRVPSYYLQEALMPRTPALMHAIEANYPGILRVSEAMTTSDFPYLTGDVLDRMMLARYREFPSPWRQFVKVATLRDFRTVSRFAADGLEGQWDAVAEQAEITYGDLSETRYQYAPQKYAKGAKISFEALMNDDLGAFEDIPDRLGRGGARTVAKFVTGLYVDSTGPHASLYDADNTVSGNPALTASSLATALGMLRGMVDSEGEPIAVEAAYLVVPPALEITARNILNAATLNLTSLMGGTSGAELLVNNWIGSALSLVVDPYIPIVASSSNGDTSWFLFASPSVGRPALEVGFIRGFAEPQLYQKLANTARVGGAVDQMAGDFQTMSQEYKGVIAFGGTRLDPKATVASEGDGS
ncbi:MAG: Mu-like prophage major head subunit gpT family protein [Chloroflexota bacterium]|nr:Mu-like prophage major head subunit gpT family protein [Chloroflexota bacterium]